MNDNQQNSTGFPNSSGQFSQYSYPTAHPSTSSDFGLLNANKESTFNNGLEDIPDVEAYEMSLRADIPSFPLVNTDNLAPTSSAHIPSQMRSHCQPHIPQLQQLLPHVHLQQQILPNLGIQLQDIGQTLNQPIAQPPAPLTSSANHPVVEDQTPLMSPASTSTRVHRNTIKLELPPYLDPESRDEDAEEGMQYPEPDLFDVRNTTMTECELDMLRQKKLGIENPKKMEVPDASAPPNKIVEFLMYNRTLKEGELVQINSYRTKKNSLSLNHVKINSDREFDQKACESLVKKLKDKKHDLQNLLDVVHSKGKQYNGCITIPRTLDGRLQVHGRKGFPHVVYGKLWRFSEMTKNETRHVDHCKHAFEMKSDLVCVNPYHYEIVMGTMIVGQRETHDSRDMNTPQQNQRYASGSGARGTSIDDMSPRFNPSIPIRQTNMQPVVPLPQRLHHPVVSHPQPVMMHQLPAHSTAAAYVPSHHYSSIPHQPGYEFLPPIHSIQQNHLPLHQYTQQFYDYQQHPQSYSPQQPGPSHPHPQYVPSPISWSPSPSNIPSTSNMPCGYNYPQPSHFVDYRAYEYFDPYGANLFSLDYNPNEGHSEQNQCRKPTVDSNKEKLQKVPDITLPKFRELCKEQFGDEFFGPDEEELVEPVFSDALAQHNDPDILGVTMKQGRVKHGDILPGNFPADVPYKDLCKFVSNITTDTVVTNGGEPETVDEDYSSNNGEKDGIWGTIIYYEHNETVGEKKCSRGNFHVDGGYIASSSRFSLGFEENVVRTAAAFKVRKVIVEGIRFSYKKDGSVWIQNNMKFPVFVTSGYLDEQSGGLQANKVHKIYGTGKMKANWTCLGRVIILEPNEPLQLLKQVFGFEKCKQLIRDRVLSRQFARMFLRKDTTTMDPIYRDKRSNEIQNEANRPQDSLAKYCCVRVSFCKGFGPAYPNRAEIKQCPVWLELKINSAYNFMDDICAMMAYRHGEIGETEFKSLGIDRFVDD